VADHAAVLEQQVGVKTGAVVAVVVEFVVVVVCFVVVVVCSVVVMSEQAAGHWTISF